MEVELTKGVMATTLPKAEKLKTKNIADNGDTVTAYRQFRPDAASTFHGP